MSTQLRKTLAYRLLDEAPNGLTFTDVRNAYIEQGKPDDEAFEDWHEVMLAFKLVKNAAGSFDKHTVQPGGLPWSEPGPAYCQFCNATTTMDNDDHEVNFCGHCGVSLTGKTASLIGSAETVDENGELKPWWRVIESINRMPQGLHSWRRTFDYLKADPAVNLHGNTLRTALYGIVKHDKYVNEIAYEMRPGAGPGGRAEQLFGPRR